MKKVLGVFFERSSLCRETNNRDEEKNGIFVNNYKFIVHGRTGHSGFQFGAKSLCQKLLHI